MRKIGQAAQKELLEFKEELERDESLEYLQFLHSHNKGYVTRATKNERYLDIVNTKSKYKFEQWHYTYKDLTKQDFKAENVYVSLNTFYSTYRRTEFLKQLNCVFIDLDCYKKGFTKVQALMNLEENYFNKSIPIPNRIIDSGRGLYLIWKIEPVPALALSLWTAIQKYLYKTLEPLGADVSALDETRILRVPGSINSESNTRVKVLDKYDYIYTLREIKKEFLPEKTTKIRIKKKVGATNLRYFFNLKNLYYSRIRDIEKLCELREYDLYGIREVLLFIYRYQQCLFLDDEEKALEKTIELNNSFILPLRLSELRGDTKSAERSFLGKNKEYRFSNGRIIKELDISEEEQKYMRTLIGEEEYSRRKSLRNKKYYENKLLAEGKITEKEKIEQRRKKIKALLQQGFKQKDICLQLNISKPTYVRDRNYLKEQGLI